MFIKSPKMRAKLKTRAQNSKEASGWGEKGVMGLKSSVLGLLDWKMLTRVS
jgi:hypothetical protein